MKKFFLTILISFFSVGVANAQHHGGVAHHGFSGGMSHPGFGIAGRPGYGGMQIPHHPAYGRNFSNPYLYRGGSNYLQNRSYYNRPRLFQPYNGGYGSRSFGYSVLPYAGYGVLPYYGVSYYNPFSVDYYWWYYFTYGVFPW